MQKIMVKADENGCPEVVSQFSSGLVSLMISNARTDTAFSIEDANSSDVVHGQILATNSLS